MRCPNFQDHPVDYNSWTILQIVLACVLEAGACASLCPGSFLANQGSQNCHMIFWLPASLSADRPQDILNGAALQGLCAGWRDRRPQSVHRVARPAWPASARIYQPIAIGICNYVSECHRRRCV